MLEKYLIKKRKKEIIKLIYKLSAFKNNKNYLYYLIIDISKIKNINIK